MQFLKRLVSYFFGQLLADDNSDTLECSHCYGTMYPINNFLNEIGEGVYQCVDCGFRIIR
jgi:Zn-finger protein